KGFTNEVQVICTTLSADLITPYDILCLNGASAALMISPLPFIGPVGAVRIGLIDDELVVNPTLQASENESTLDLIVVGTKEGLTMVEAGAGEIPEDKLLEALAQAHEEIKKLCEIQEELARSVGRGRGGLRRAEPGADDGVHRKRHPAPGAGAPEPGDAGRVDPARGDR